MKLLQDSRCTTIQHIFLSKGPPMRMFPPELNRSTSEDKTTNMQIHIKRYMYYQKYRLVDDGDCLVQFISLQA